MRNAGAVLVLLISSWLASSLALAKPLPKGMKVFSKADKLYVELKGMTVAMLDSEAAAAHIFGKVQSAELSDDGKQIVVKVEDCSMGDPDEGIEFPLATIEARVENILGMKLHVKKQYAEAIPHFVTAVKQDPGTPMYATNLLAAQAMAKLFDDADKTLAASGPLNPAYFGWRLIVDPELVGLRGRPSTRTFVPEKPSTLTWANLGVATNPLGLIAVSEWSFYGGPGAPGGEDLVIYEPKQGKLLLRLPVVALADACGGGGDGDGGVRCTKQMTAHTAANTKVVNLVLSTLGFQKQPAIKLESSSDVKFVSADKQVSVEFVDKPTAQMIVKRGKLTTSVPDVEVPKSISIAGNLVVLQYRQNAFMACDGDAQRSYSEFRVIK